MHIKHKWTVTRGKEREGNGKWKPTEPESVTSVIHEIKGSTICTYIWKSGQVVCCFSTTPLSILYRMQFSAASVYVCTYLSPCVDVDLVIHISLHLFPRVEGAIQPVAEMSECADKLCDGKGLDTGQ